MTAYVVIVTYKGFEFFYSTPNGRPEVFTSELTANGAANHVNTVYKDGYSARVEPFQLPTLNHQ